MILLKQATRSILTFNKLSTLRKFSQKVQQQQLEEGLVFSRLTNENAGIATFGLNRAKAKNAFSMSLVNQIIETLDNVAVDNSLRVLVIHSLVPGVFGAGADLKERASMSPQQVSLFVTSLRTMLNKIHQLPIPVIAAIDGIALGGGLELALACDIRVASSSAKMGLVETRLAIIPGAGGTQRLPRLISPALAKELIYTARVFDGDEAKSMGIVNHSLKQTEAGNVAFQHALSISREILPNGPFAVKMAKAAINNGLETDLNTAFEFEKAYYAQIIPTKDRIEGLTAFREKRPPKYIGE